MGTFPSLEGRRPTAVAGPSFLTTLLFSTLAALTLALATAPAAAQGGVGDLTVTPTRLVFEGRARTLPISLIHRGTEPATYRIEFVEQRMTEDGRFEPIDEPLEGERLASDLVRYSPRRVTLEPGVAQTIRLALRKPADLAPGEYRSHLALYAEPSTDAGASIEDAESDDDELGVRLIPIYRVTVPVIVRHEAPDSTLEATAALEVRGPITIQPAVQPDAPDAPDEPPILPLRLGRAGERSLFGDLDVVFEPERSESQRGSDEEGDKEPPIVLAQVKGLAVYVPNASRSFDLPLHPPDGLDLQSGRLRVIFAENEREDGARAELLIDLVLIDLALIDPVLIDPVLVAEDTEPEPAP